jgi:hypothetical protein
MIDLAYENPGKIMSGVPVTVILYIFRMMVF